MKKIFFLSCFVFRSFSTSAQPIITSSINPQAGDQYKVKYGAEGIAYNYALTGANYTWSYSAMFFNTYIGNQVIFQTAASAPNGATFNTSDIAGKDTFNNYLFYTTDTSNLIVDGEIESGSIQIKYDNPELLFSYPLTYQKTYSDSFTATYQANSMIYKRKGFNKMSVDGYGTLTLPSKTFSNLLRIKQVETILDSNTSGGADISISKTSYSWYRTTDKFPVFLVEIKTVGSTTNKFIYLNAVSSTGIKEQADNKPVTYHLYPNPPLADGKTIFKMKINSVSLIGMECVNVAGQKVLELPEEKYFPGNFSREIDFSNIASGAYFLNVTVNGERNSMPVRVK